MEIELEPDWKPSPDICRCCLVKNGLWDLTKSYDSTEPVKEKLADLLRDCFGISLSYLSEENVSRLICDTCIDQLRHANYFRKQVQTAEQRFSKHFIDKRNHEGQLFTSVHIKTEPDLESYDISNSSESPPPNIDFTWCAQVRDPVQIKKKSTAQKKLVNSRRRKAATKKALQTPTEQTGTQKPKRKIQNTELNRLIRLNTALILKNSTVVPFRNKRNNNGKYTCFYCETDFFEIKDIREHVTEVHENITEDHIMTILKLPAVFVLTKADISVVRCKICQKDEQSLDGLIKHLTDVHKKTYHRVDFKPSHGILAFFLESETPTCHECKKEFPFFRALVAHMTAQHNHNFACVECDKKFLFKQNLNQHILKCHSEQTQAKYKCKFCDETFEKSCVRQNHMKKIHGHGRFKCVECGATFMEHQQRVRHAVEVHNYRRPLFKCEICSKAFMTASILSCHIRTHGDNKVHNCDICGKKLTSRYSLKVHLRIHSGERPYACQFCEKRFKSLGTLTTHERGHLNDKRYVCEVCDAAFIQIHCLRRHYTSRHPDCGIDLKSIRAKKKD